ncbi:zinc finger protein OZF-like [Penaeus chinensis]|uniref:zinc finger protein OZF-like n=1 Tax=Penaeus chinensis TaxID=139456 RepID=UPI001FB73B9B|nr:zinc finger protein OZF-like [Penaeus chinensis]
MIHKSHTTAQRSFRCHVCGKVFGQKGHLLIHKNVHAEVRPFGCDTCGRRFTQKGNLLRHSLLHTNEKSFGCGICRKFFVQKAHLVKHVVVHRQRLAALKRCRRREASERGSSAEETSLRCKASCSMTRRPDASVEFIGNSTEFSPGRNRWPSEKAERHCLIPRSRSSESGESSLYNFQIRQKVIRCFRDTRMSRKSHTTAQRSFRCHVCGKVFGQKGNLLIHKNVHAEVRPFGCDTCGRRFTQKGNLLRHSLLHTNEKPFGCGICRKFFVQKAHLVKHVVVHRQKLVALKRCRRREASERGSSAEAKETSLRCKVCGLQFMRIYKLMEHLKAQHILGREGQ